MKRIVIIFAVLLAVSSCKKLDVILVSGKIVNPVDKEVLVYDRFLMKSDTIPVNTDGTFSKSVSCSDEHLGLFKHGNFYIPVNLKPGSTINIDFNIEDVNSEYLYRCTKNDWEKFVKEKELGGIQIYAPYGRNSEISKKYAIRGTPTYLIIDKEGKIAEFDSSRPSNPETEKKLLELAMK